MAGTRELFPSIPPELTTAQLAALGTVLGSSNKGATVWCTDWAGGARLVFWDGTVWSALDTTGGGGGSGLTNTEVMARIFLRL